MDMDTDMERSTAPEIQMVYRVPEDNQAIHDVEWFNKNQNNFIHFTKQEDDPKIIFQLVKQRYATLASTGYFTFKYEYILQIIKAVEIVHQAGFTIKYLSPSQIYYDCSLERQHIRRNGLVLNKDVKSKCPKLIDRQEFLKNLVLAYYGVPRKDNQVQKTDINYQAPETIKGQPTTQQADIWSIGCLFYHFISQGKHLIDNPQQDITEQMILDKLHLVKSLTPYSRYQTKTYNIIIQCLKAAPQSRITLEKLTKKITKLYEKEQKLHLKLFNYDHEQSQCFSYQDKFLEKLDISLEEKQIIRSDLAKFQFLPTLGDYMWTLPVNKDQQKTIQYLIMLKQLHLRYKFRQSLLDNTNPLYAKENVCSKVLESLEQQLCYETYYINCADNQELKDTFRHIQITKAQTINQELFDRLDIVTQQLNDRVTSQYKFLIKCLHNIDQVFNHQNLAQNFNEYFTISKASLENEKLYNQLIRFICAGQIREPATPEIFDRLLNNMI